MFVGLPLIALTVEILRARVLETRLDSAKEAACEAYAVSLDVVEFRRSGKISFRPDAASAAAESLRAVAKEARPRVAEVRTGVRADQVVAIQCADRATLQPMISNLPPVRVHASAIATAGLAHNGDQQLFSRP